MRKPLTAGLTNLAVGDDLLRPYATVRQNTNINDARQNMALLAAKLGTPAGQVQIGNLKGWNWAQLPNGDGTSTQVMAFAPTDADNNPMWDMSAGNAVMLTKTGDTQPVHYVMSQPPSQSYGSFVATRTPCSHTADGDFLPDGVATSYDYTTGIGTIDPSISNVFNGIGVNTIPNTVKRKSTPTFSYVAPINAKAGDLWQRPSDAMVFRYAAGNVARYMPQQNATFTTRKALVAISAGQWVYESPITSDSIAPAYNGAPSAFGKVLGIAPYAIAANQYGVIQCSGDYIDTTARTKGSLLYIGGNGLVTTTTPDSSSAYFSQIVGIQGQSTLYFTIRIEQPIKLNQNTDDIMLITATNMTGSSIAAGTPVEIYNSSGTIYVRPCDMTTANTYPCRGITAEAIAYTATGSVTTIGINNAVSGLTIGAQWCSTSSAGTLTSTRPTSPSTAKRQYVGYAITSTSIYVNPDGEYVTL